MFPLKTNIPLADRETGNIVLTLVIMSFLLTTGIYLLDGLTTHANIYQKDYKLPFPELEQSLSNIIDCTATKAHVGNCTAGTAVQLYADATTTLSFLNDGIPAGANQSWQFKVLCREPGVYSIYVRKQFQDQRVSEWSKPYDFSCN